LPYIIFSDEIVKKFTSLRTASLTSLWPLIPSVLPATLCGALGLLLGGCAHMALPSFMPQKQPLATADVTGSIKPAAAASGLENTAQPSTEDKTEHKTEHALQNAIATELPTALAGAIDAQDWPQVQIALNAALDPNAEGQSVNWDNSPSRSKGSFTPFSVATLAGNRLCRPFRAEVSTDQPVRHFEGLGCRDLRGSWEIMSFAPSKPLKTAARSG
jgi:surface antigen